MGFDNNLSEHFNQLLLCDENINSVLGAGLDLPTAFWIAQFHSGAELPEFATIVMDDFLGCRDKFHDVAGGQPRKQNSI